MYKKKGNKKKNIMDSLDAKPHTRDQSNKVPTNKARSMSPEKYFNTNLQEQSGIFFPFGLKFLTISLAVILQNNVEK